MMNKILTWNFVSRKSGFRSGKSGDKSSGFPAFKVFRAAALAATFRLEIWAST